MTMWNHKAADELAAAIDKHIRKSTTDSKQRDQLLGVYRAAKRAAAMDQTNREALANIRGSLCFLCRSQTMYECDAGKGWSANCAFIRENS